MFCSFKNIRQNFKTERRAVAYSGIEPRDDIFTLDIHERKRFLESPKHEVSTIPSVESAIFKLYACTLKQAINKIGGGNGRAVSNFEARTSNRP